MSKRTPGTWLMLVVMVALVTACSNTTPSTTTDEQPVTEEVMMDKDESGGEMMDKDESGEEMTDDDKAGDEMMENKDESSEKMMDEDESGEEMTDKDESGEEMMDKDESDGEMMDKDESGEEMMDKDEASEEMADEDDASEEMMDDDKAEEAMTVPDWFNVELTDVNTGETFRIADFQGKVVLLETMAVWCPSCTRQQQEVKELHEMLGERDDFVSVALDVDSNESEDFLKAHAERNDFDWHFAVSPREVNRALGNLYSVQYLNPPVMPMMIINQQGQVYGLPFGRVKEASNLKATIETHLNGE